MHGGSEPKILYYLSSDEPFSSRWDEIVERVFAPASSSQSRAVETLFSYTDSVKIYMEKGVYVLCEMKNGTRAGKGRCGIVFHPFTIAGGQQSNAEKDHNAQLLTTFAGPQVKVFFAKMSYLQ